MTTPRRFRLLLPVALAAVLSLGACSGSDDDDGTAQVASLAEAGATATAKAAVDAEQELNDYTECLRTQGVDVPDITVDADGNASFGPGAGGGGGAGGDIDREALTAAQKVCGDPPASLTSGIQDSINSPEFQDAALKFAQCMRGEGIEMADPDFSQGLGAAGGNPFGDLDRDDPATAAALEICQKAFASVLPGGGN